MFGSLTAILLSGLLNFVGKRYPHLTGEGRIQPGEHDELNPQQEEITGRMDVSHIAAGGSIVIEDFLEGEEASFIALADGRVDSNALLEDCRNTSKRLVHGDMAQLAEATGSVISSVLFGALAGSKALPMQRTAFEAAIREIAATSSHLLASLQLGARAR